MYDYLDTTAKIYSSRIDNINKTLQEIHNEVKIKAAIQNKTKNSTNDEYLRVMKKVNSELKLFCDSIVNIFSKIKIYLW